MAEVKSLLHLVQIFSLKAKNFKNIFNSNSMRRTNKTDIVFLLRPLEWLKKLFFKMGNKIVKRNISQYDFAR